MKSAAQPRKRFVGSKSSTPSKPGVLYTVANQIPREILNDVQLNSAIALLPDNYSFEIHKTIHHVRKNNAKMVALQMPEGLQMFACTIADTIERFTKALTVIMGDVTYGACCIDDYTAVALGCDMLVHYGHSCLVPIDQTTIKTLYVFVEIAIDSAHLSRTIRLNFPAGRQQFHELLLDSEEADAEIPAGQQIGPRRQHLQLEGPESSSIPFGSGDFSDHEPTRLALVSTIQFVAALQRLKEDLTIELSDYSAHSSQNSSSQLADTQRSLFWTGKYEATIPRSKPLSPGEILGCTAPRLRDVDALIYLGDGRFHLESIMIANPSIPAFRYDPYSKKLTRERYDHREMLRMRDRAVQSAKRSIDALVTVTDSSISSVPPTWGVVLGTLGRQGNLNQLLAITHQLSVMPTAIPYVPILLSELSPAKLALFNPHISTFVQTSCPRLSIDWGYAFDRPLLSPYECAVAVGRAAGWMDERNEGPPKAIDKPGELQNYPMDFYEAGSMWALARIKGIDLKILAR